MDIQNEKYKYLAHFSGFICNLEIKTLMITKEYNVEYDIAEGIRYKILVKYLRFKSSKFAYFSTF